MPKKTDDHKKFWNDVVKPDYDDFIKNKGDIRKGFHSATSVNHMADWIYQSNPEYFNALKFKDKEVQERPVHNSSTFANYVRDQLSDFEVVRGVANASKHLTVMQAKHADAPTSAANTYVSDSSFDSSAFDRDSFDTGKVMQEGASGPFPLDEKVTSVFEFWPGFCKKHNMPLD